MANQYRNKIVYYGETLMDLTADTVTPATLLSGYTAHDASGAPITGTLVPQTEGVVVVEEEDEHGGIIKHITAIDLSNDTVTAGTLLSGYTAHDRFGNSVTGNLVPGGVDTSNDTVTVNTLLAGYTAHDATGAQIVGAFAAPDLSSDTVTPASMLYGVTAHDASGAAITGTIQTVVGGTPVATKGTVSNHSVAITPSVTNVTGYITGGTLTGTAVTVSASELVSGSETKTENGTYDVTNLAEVVVAVSGGSPNLQSKTATPSETAQTIEPDAGYDGLSEVSVGAISSTYVGSGVARKASSDLTVSGATVTAPAGYYASAASKSVATATQATPSVSIDSTTGVVTATATQSAGYVSAGTKSRTLELSTQAAVTITPSETAQTAVSAGKYTLGAVSVAAIPSDYIGSDITVDPTPTASGATVTIPEGYYSEQTTKSVATATQATPSISVNTSTGLITASATQTAGYVSAGTKSATEQLTVQAAKTVTPTESEQTAVAANVYTTGVVKVGAISPTYVGSDVPTQAAKTVTPTESEQNAVSSGVYTTGVVKVGAISSTYVGSGITQRDDTDLTVSGATVTVPSGYYASQETKSVASGSVTSPTSISGTSATVSTGTNTLTLTKSVSVTPRVTTAGYVSAGTAGNSSVSLTASVTTQAAKTVTPTKSSQQAVASGVYTTGAITVAAIPSNYIDTSDATALAGDIVSGETAYVDGSKVTGTLVIQTYYTGSSAPSPSLGADGDIYIQQ